MTQVTVELPDAAFAALRTDPAGMAQEVRWRVAVAWYHESLVSQETAAQIAGMTRLQFLEELSRRKLPVAVLDIHELRRELADG